jgi:hypothetical protein
MKVEHAYVSSEQSYKEVTTHPSRPPPRPPVRVCSLSRMSFHRKLPASSAPRLRRARKREYVCISSHIMQMKVSLHPHKTKT